MATLWTAACGDGDPDLTGPPPAVNRPPAAVGIVPAQTVSAGETATIDMSSYFRDPDGDALSYAAASSNAGVVGVSVAGGSVTVTALAKGAGTVTVEARDPQGLLAQQRFQVTVPNRAPEAVGTIPAQTVFAGETASVDVSAYFRDPDGDPLTYSAASSAAALVSASVSGSTLTLTGVAAGTATVTATARDPDGGTAEQVIPVTVPNRGPLAVGSIPARTISVGETETVEVASYFSDPDGDALSYDATSSNAGIADVSVADGSVTVTALARGVVTVTVAAHDPQDLIAQQRFQVTVETSNRAPEAVGTIPAQTVATARTATVDVSSYFRDPDGDPLTYTATSSAAGVVSASVSGSTLTLTGVAAGTATVTVTASDPDGLAAVSSFGVTVETPASGSFQIELVLATSVTRAQEAAFRRAAERWMTILAPTELPDFEAQRWTCGDDPRFERHAAIDDVMIVAVVEEIDGPGGTLAAAAPCWVRTASQLPIYGRMRLDAADLGRQERIGHLEDLILHEMGHVLGIGSIWDDLGLLRNPASEDEAPDTHFVGPLTIDAFDEAGGTGYRGAKVPVENTGGPGTRNGHWRETVLEAELMTGWSEEGRTEPLSAITIQSLADVGYEVDLTAADPYRLPDADAARLIEPGRLIPYGDDIWRGPVVIVDADGRIVRVIPG